MLNQDIVFIATWWLLFFIIGIVFLPLTMRIFYNFFDKGYIFAKIIGVAFISYAIFVLGFLKILPFETQNIFLIAGIFLLINLYIGKKNFLLDIKDKLPIFILEEFMFLTILIFWSFVHAHAPDIHGLEKYMDFGFINSILRAKYFPPLDMWFTPYPINYYYFGHLITAVLTKLSSLPSNITFNLMLSTIAALSFTSAFSIGANLIYQFKIQNSKFKITSQKLKVLLGGLLTAFILNFAGNLHTIYLFFKPYENENPVPFWSLIFSPQAFPNSYWYPNATRFIHNTIHEFPIYSNVVSDLHGHFLDIPFVLLTIAVLLSLFYKRVILKPERLKGLDSSLRQARLGFVQNDIMMATLISFLLAVMYMTNAWDGIIYLILTIFVFSYLIFKQLLYSRNLKNQKLNLKDVTQNSKLFNLPILSFIAHLSFLILILGAGFFLFSLPFNLNFKPFASGIGILCAPKLLTDIGKFGPFLFEPNHCQKSPLWQLLILYGFFYFWVISFLATQIKNQKSKIKNLLVSDIFVLILITLSTILIIIPEFIYVKDIYPAHYRANTMFKLVYQSFLILSLVSGYIIVRLFANLKSRLSPTGEISNRYLKFVYLFVGSICLLLVFLYPYFAIRSYFGDFKVYFGLNGTNYLKSLYPSDYAAIQWIDKNIKGQPIILEAQGDSYTDYGRISTNTGLPTVLGWTVHEWLWRGTYDIPAPRIPEIANMYETQNLEETKILLKKYNISLVFIGALERQKYSDLNEKKFQVLGKIIYQKGSTEIFKID